MIHHDHDRRLPRVGAASSPQRHVRLSAAAAPAPSVEGAHEAIPQLEVARAHSRRLRNRVGAPATKSASGVRAGTDDGPDGNGAAALAPAFDDFVGDDVPDLVQAPGGRVGFGEAGGGARPARGVAAAGAPRPGLRAAADPFGRRGLEAAGRRGERTTVMRASAMMGPGAPDAFPGREMDAGQRGRGGSAREAGAARSAPSRCDAETRRGSSQSAQRHGR